MMVDWYNRLDVQYEMIRFLKDREFACLVPSCHKDMNMAKRSTRTLRAHNAQSISYILYKMLKFNTRQTVYNLYNSMATYDGGVFKIPPALEMRKKRANQWNAICHRKMRGYDWLIDIDAGSRMEMKDAVESAISVMERLDKGGVPFEMRFSGMGFHFIVPHDFFGPLKLSFDPFAGKNIYQLYDALSKKLHDNLSEMVDHNINDHRRLAKLPYSLAFYKGGDVFVCAPLLFRDDLHHFDDDLYQPFNMMDVRYRGSTMFNDKHRGDPVRFIFDMLGGVE